MLVNRVYITWPIQFKLFEVPAIVGSIVVVGALTRCTLLHSMCDLKVTQTNVQCSQIQEPGHNTAEAPPPKKKQEVLYKRWRRSRLQ